LELGLGLVKVGLGLDDGVINSLRLLILHSPMVVLKEKEHQKISSALVNSFHLEFGLKNLFPN